MCVCVCVLCVCDFVRSVQFLKRNSQKESKIFCVCIRAKTKSGILSGFDNFCTKVDFNTALSHDTLPILLVNILVSCDIYTLPGLYAKPKSAITKSVPPCGCLVNLRIHFSQEPQV